MKKVRFAQALDVELWVDIEVPDDYTDEDIADYIQEFPLNVTVVEVEGNYDHANTDVYVHSVDYHGAAEVQGEDSDE